MDYKFRTYHVAKLHYIDKMKQKDIAQMLGISTMIVSRILKKAESEGIVSIYVKMPMELDLNLGYDIIKKFPNLRECLVLKKQDGADNRNLIGNLASQYVVDILQPNGIIGLSWGKTICEFVQSLPLLELPELNVIQLTGGFLNLSNYLMMPSNIVKIASERLGCLSLFINAPMFVSSIDIKEQLVKDTTNHHISELAKKSDINIIGISPLSIESTASKVNIIDSKDIDELKELGAVGDIAGFFIDKKGDQINWSKKNLYMGVDLEIISQAKYVLCLASGKDKAEVCNLGINKKYFNVLITTEDLARELMNL